MENQNLELQTIYPKIHEIRGLKVMLDFDLAELYDVETKVLNQAVKRNAGRFPADFMFQLSLEEWQELRTERIQRWSQIVTTSDKFRRESHQPFAFTEQGVAMLSGVLRSEKAIKVNIAIMRTFVEMRRFALNYKELSDKLLELEARFGKEIAVIHEVIRMLASEKNKATGWENREPIGYKK